MNINYQFFYLYNNNTLNKYNIDTDILLLLYLKNISILFVEILYYQCHKINLILVTNITREDLAFLSLVKKKLIKRKKKREQFSLHFYEIIIRVSRATLGSTTSFKATHAISKRFILFLAFNLLTSYIIIQSKKLQENYQKF